MKTRKTLKQLIKSYQLILRHLGFELNPHFKETFLHVERMKTNRTKISFIKPEKIKGLEENLEDFKLNPQDQEQREKHFSAVRPSKFLQSMVVNSDKNNNLLTTISEQFSKDFICNIKHTFELFEGEEIKDIYNTASVVGCMAKSPKSYFQVYADTENLQLATLRDGECTLIRSLLWYDKETNNYFLDNSYEQMTINGENEIRKQYQARLLDEVLNYISKTKRHSDSSASIGFNRFGCSFLGSLDFTQVEKIKEKYKKELNGKRIESEGGEDFVLNPIIKDFDYDDYCSFPYSDTFASIGKYGERTGKWFYSCNEGNSDYVCLRSQDGYDQNNNGIMCECCEERIDEDYIHYSELEEEHLCDDCSCYIEERDDTCRRDNATYNNYTDRYHYSCDLD
jgi:hypothetical protein